ncbi:hypothetical protein [Nocardioides stalactiti]|uniref:hypothetical protein n=1 Tax=Nocardioides stalactiti TaxID=2755356 RepID=UPI0016009C08|nr:hypothetical protein [Nocardioides stalactiti]
MPRTLLALLACLFVVGCSNDGDNAEGGGSGRNSSGADGGLASCGLEKDTLVPTLKAAVPTESSARVTMEMNGPGIEITYDATMTYRPGGVDMELSAVQDGREIALVIVDGRIFVADANGAFREVSDDDPTGAPLRDVAGDLDFVGTFDAMEAGIVDVGAVDTATIDGAPACRYRIDVDTAAASQAEGDPVPPGMPDTLTYRMVVDSDDLIRAVEFSLLGVEAEGELNWIDPVDIEVPEVG